jgi:hypothetical protein
MLCGRNILTGVAFVTQLSSTAGISVRRIVWVTANCCFMSDISHLSIYIYIYIYIYGARGGAGGRWLRHCATNPRDGVIVILQ